MLLSRVQHEGGAPKLVQGFTQGKGSLSRRKGTAGDDYGLKVIIQTSTIANRVCACYKYIPYPPGVYRDT